VDVPVMLRKRSVQVGLAVAGAVLLLIVFVVSGVNGVRNEGIDRETQLSAQYLKNQNEIGTYISTFYETLGIADRKTDKLNAVLVEAVKGRYEGETSAQPGQGQLFSAISEAYPDLSTQGDLYDRMVDIIQAGRDGYKNEQNVLLDQLRVYDNWRKKGVFKSMFIRMAGFPSESLEARIGTAVSRGSDARDQMYLLVLPGQAVEAYQTGQLEPLTVPPAGGR
jgi:hypothetical protein